MVEINETHPVTNAKYSCTILNEPVQLRWVTCTDWLNRMLILALVSQRFYYWPTAMSASRAI